MADTRQGKKQNHDKNFTAAKDFKAGKKIGRKKQVWVNDGTSAFELSPGIVSFTRGFWKKI
jgi:hypothetical protein